MGLPPHGGAAGSRRDGGLAAGAAATTASAVVAEPIRVTVRLRPVSSWEAETMPPPWPVQHAPGEVRVFAARMGPARWVSGVR